MKKFFAILLLSACLSLSSCVTADVTVTAGESAENRFPEESGMKMTVNLSSGTIHPDDDCRYAKNTKEENKKTVYYSKIEMALADGYKLCSACAAEYKTTEEDHD